MQAAHALPLSMLRAEDKECLLVTLREIQGCVQILINLRDAGCLTGAGPSAGEDRSGPVPVPAPAGRPPRTRGLRAALAAAALLLLAGAAVLLSRDETAGTVEAVLAQAGRGLREGVGTEDHDPGAVRLAALGESETLGRDLAARSRRLDADMEALDLNVVRRRGELDLVGASIEGLRRAAKADEEGWRAAAAAKEAAEAGAAEARAGIEAATREMAALRAQIAEQREALDAARTEGESARAALRAEIAEQVGRIEAARTEGETGIRQVADRLSELGRTAQTNHEAIQRLAGTIGGLEETSRGIDAARDQLSRQRERLVDLASGGTEADRALSEIKGRLAVLKVSLAGTAGQDASGKDSASKGLGIKEAGTGTPAAMTVVALPARTEAALQPEEWRRIQQVLTKAGHYAGKTDGRPGEETRTAIAKFQRGLGAPATGRLSPAQIDRLLPPVPVKQPIAAR
ncbi:MULTISPECIES: peptidoglycan-binding domain-containing protein [Methylobacterium]|uniref:peptidoglycan-binding domain-containing protein n=1 Tax=Methylobacterium TaxID=407 RepID=UPI0013EA6548|nr:peptidoglycan-binding domain-containing protein [Methylobacterium sp. DB0501]NGM33276.1 hypothetical protein [Methylobacterium sp. DB0501]